MKGSQESLTTVVLKTCGPAAQANPSTDGSRRELWPTPDATGANDGTPWEKFHASMMERRERVKQAVLEGKTEQGSGRSPNLCAAVQNPLWATPRTKDAEGWMMNQARADAGKPEDTLTGQATNRDKTNGKLNPRWVETLMGLPVGWTMSSCATPVTIEPTSFGCLATESSPQPQPELL